MTALTLAGLGRVLAVGGGFALVAAAFLPWTARGVVALDLGALGWGFARQPTVALLLVALAAAAALSGLATGWIWPRLIAAIGGALLVLTWLATGPDATLTNGVWTALGGCVALLLSAGLAPASRERRHAHEGRHAERDPGHQRDVHA